MGFLLFTEDEDLGALNLYSRRPGAFTEASELAGWLLASHAAVAFSSARTHAQMERAVATRHVIGEAMGISWAATTSPRSRLSTCCAVTRSRTTSSSVRSPDGSASRAAFRDAGGGRLPRHHVRTRGT